MEKRYCVKKMEGFRLLVTDCGVEIGYSPESGVQIVERDGLPFKDFIGSGELLPYEDWRLPAEVRAADLASRLSIEEIAGLMLYSPQNWLPMPSDTYGGCPFAESGMKPWDLSDSQLKFLTADNVRHVLVGKVESPGTAARWNNRVQALCEGRGHGIPANNSSDPRHYATADAEFAAGCGGKISLWSNMLGLAATFSPEMVEAFARTAAREYRLLGIATALSPGHRPSLVSLQQHFRLRPIPCGCSHSRLRRRVPIARWQGLERPQRQHNGEALARRRKR